MRPNLKPKKGEDTQITLIQHPNKMRIARLRKGLSQGQMARLVGTTQPTYSRIEHGTTQQPDVEILTRIADVLKIPMDELLAKEGLEATRPKIEQIEPELSPKDIPGVIRDLKTLLDEGVITEAQFQEKREQLLARL